jgi:hypothetical protein
MAKQFVTIAGFSSFYGLIPFEEGQIVFLRKEPENLHDAEAIAVHLPYIGTVGYIANSPRSVVRGTMSAGRLYDTVENDAVARVMFIAESHIICELLSKKKTGYYLSKFGEYEAELRRLVEDGSEADAEMLSETAFSGTDTSPIRITPLWKK